MILNLNPFEPHTETNSISISVDLERVESRLICKYYLEDPKGLVHIENSQIVDQRTKGLWKSTCFELFFKSKESDKYWEVNVDAHLNWNLYHFDSYRSHEERELESYSNLMRSRRFEERLECFFEVDTQDILQPQDLIQINCCVILKHRSGLKSYWSVHHKTGKPDFHNVENFILLV